MHLILLQKQNGFFKFNKNFLNGCYYFSNLPGSNHLLSKYLVCILILLLKHLIIFCIMRKAYHYKCFLLKAGDCNLLLGKALLCGDLQYSLCRVLNLLFFQNSSVQTYLSLQVSHEMM